jgi:hypothetical protein
MLTGLILYAVHAAVRPLTKHGPRRATAAQAGTGRLAQ